MASYEGLSMREIADRTGDSFVSVRHHYYRGLQRLRSFISGEGTGNRPLEASVPEHQQRGMPEHEPYEALCALAAGGLLEGAEFVDFQVHLKECSDCRFDFQELSSLVTRELPQAQGPFRQKLAAMTSKPLPYSRPRFLRRARAEGVVFSRKVETPARSSPWYFRPVTMLAPAAALVVVAVSLTVYHFPETPDKARAKDGAAA